MTVTAREVWKAASERLLNAAPHTPLYELLRLAGLEREAYAAMTEEEKPKEKPNVP